MRFSEHKKRKTFRDVFEEVGAVLVSSAPHWQGWGGWGGLGRTLNQIRVDRAVLGKVWEANWKT